MKYFKSVLIRKYAKASVVLFGVLLGVFIYSCDLGFRSIVFADEMKSGLTFKETSTEGNSECNLQLLEKTKKRVHHNFLVTFLAKESSIERKNTHSDEQAEFFNGIKQLRKVVVSRITGML